MMYFINIITSFNIINYRYEVFMIVEIIKNICKYNNFKIIQIIKFKLVTYLCNSSNKNKNIQINQYQ